MKKKILFLILITFSLLLTSCIDYSNYKDVDIPDEKVGSAKIPSYWEFEVVDDWIQIIDTEKDEVIGIQYFRGKHFMIGQAVYDERIYNPYFNDYELVGSSYTSGNSNGGNWGTAILTKNEMTYTYRFIEFMGSEDGYYDARIIITDDLVEDNILKNIVSSYKR